MEPPTLPRNRALRFSGLPRMAIASFEPFASWTAPRGVAPETSSPVTGAAHWVMGPAKPTSRATRAAAAGLKGFCPRPPKSSFTTMIAKTLPTMQSHQGAPGGRFRARITPVTRALKSPTVGFRRMARDQAYSAKMLNAEQ